MNAVVLHESRGRMRLRLKQKNISLADADLLETWLSQQSWADSVVVHERTCCVIIYYKGARQSVIDCFRSLTWQTIKTDIPAPVHSSRELSRDFQEKLVSKIMWKAIRSMFFPAPLRTALVLYHMAPFLRKGLDCIIHRKIKVELLDAISIAISVLRMDFDTAGSVMFLLEIGELLEDWTRKKSVDDLARCMSLNVDRVWIRTENGDILTSISQVCPGDKAVVRLGGVIPLDGVVLEGDVMVNQASLTGESIPVAKRPGSSVYAGTVVEEGECVMEVKQASGDSRYDKIITMIEQSEQLKSSAESKASALADRLVPYTFAGSLLSLAITRNTTRALSVLMVDFSCALKLAMPLAVLSAMREAGKRHITVKGGKFLETAAKADVIVFDKTGTLTYACPKVAGIIPFGANNTEDMLRLAACLEEHFPHSMANAVVSAAKERGLDHDEFHSKAEYIVAHGIASKVNDKRVLIGSYHFIFEDEGCTVPEGEKEKFNELKPEFSHLYLAIGGVLSAVIYISDPLRKEAPAVLKALKRLGIKKTVMLTGDSYRTAASIAAQLGADDFMAEALPSDKAKYIADLKKEGHTVIMVGDGINDSPALSEANAGIAISDGAAIAREIADITIAAENLWELVKLRIIADELMKRIKSNYRFVIGFNGTLIFLGVAGLIQPAMSATIHNLSTVGVSLRSMSPLPLEKYDVKKLSENA